MNEQPAQTSRRKSRLPMVSCIMPATGKPVYVEQLIDMFLRQDYRNKELVIVYTRETDLPDILFPLSVRLIRSTTKVWGNMRNEACRYARGAIIGHWDDDAMSNANRISCQVTPILQGQADVTGFTGYGFYNVLTGLHGFRPSSQQLAGAGVVGDSLFYNRRVWDNLSYYPNITGADASFLERIIKRGARLQAINSDDDYILLRTDNGDYDQSGKAYSTLPEWAKRYTDAYSKIANAKYPKPVLTTGRPKLAAQDKWDKDIRQLYPFTRTNKINYHKTVNRTFYGFFFSAGTFFALCLTAAFIISMNEPLTFSGSSYSPRFFLSVAFFWAFAMTANLIIFGLIIVPL